MALLGVEDGVAAFTLNRPHVGNAVNFAMVGRLDLLLTDLEARDDVAALVFRGAGDRFFCTGGDLDEYPRLDSDRGARELGPGDVVTERSAVEDATALAQAAAALPRSSVRVALQLLDGDSEARHVADAFDRLWGRGAPCHSAALAGAARRAERSSA